MRTSSGQGNRTKRFPSEVLEICEQSIDRVYMRRERKHLQDVLDHAIVKVREENRLRPADMALPLPTRRLVKRLVEDIPAFDQCTARYGYDAAVRRFPGAASRYLERALGDKAVALFVSGAAGDQNPIYFKQTYDLREIRIKDYAKRGQDISNAMPPGGQGLDRKNPEVARLMEEQKEMATSMGQLLGEEVLHAIRGANAGETNVRIFGKETTIDCPGRQRSDQGRGGVQGTYTDGPEIHITLDLVMVNDIAVGAVNGEVYNEIAQRLKRESPYANTFMVTVTNGYANSGYIPDDASFGHQTFEVLSSRLRPGCAETKIVDGLTGMMPKIAY